MAAHVKGRAIAIEFERSCSDGVYRIDLRAFGDASTTSLYVPWGEGDLGKFAREGPESRSFNSVYLCTPLTAPEKRRRMEEEARLRFATDLELPPHFREAFCAVSASRDKTEVQEYTWDHTNECIHHHRFFFGSSGVRCAMKPFEQEATCKGRLDCKDFMSAAGNYKCHKYAYMKDGDWEHQPGGDKIGLR